MSADPASSCYTLAWYSAADPTAHPFPGACVSPNRIRFEGDRAVYSVSESGGPQLVLSDLQGQTRAVAGSTLGFDYDGTRVVYACSGGRVAALVEDDLAGAPDAGFCASLKPPAVRGCHSSAEPLFVDTVARCPVTVSASRAKVDSSGVVDAAGEVPEGLRGNDPAAAHRGQAHASGSRSRSS